VVLKTRDFGDIEINDADIIQFDIPIFGFEDYRRFAFLYDETVSEHFVWLQSVEEPELCFILVDPGLIVVDYAPAIPAGVQKALGEGDLMCWLMVVIKEDFNHSTVNLKSPLVVNSQTKIGAQMILEENYSIHHPLLAQKEGA